MGKETKMEKNEEVLDLTELLGSDENLVNSFKISGMDDKTKACKYDIVDEKKMEKIGYVEIGLYENKKEEKADVKTTSKKKANNRVSEKTSDDSTEKTLKGKTTKTKASGSKETATKKTVTRKTSNSKSISTAEKTITKRTKTKKSEDGIEK